MLSSAQGGERISAVVTRRQKKKRAACRRLSSTPRSARVQDGSGQLSWHVVRGSVQKRVKVTGQPRTFPFLLHRLFRFLFLFFVVLFWGWGEGGGYFITGPIK